MSTRTALLGAASLLALAVSVGPALADGMPSRGRIAGEGPRTCSTTGNVGLTTDYVFRGISQSNEEAAVQGGVDFTCGKFYAGVWASSIYTEGGSAEVDIYGGYKFGAGPLNFDVGFIYYAYPGATFLDDVLELKAGVSGDIWKGGTLGGTAFYALDPEILTLEGTFSQALPKVGMFAPTFSASLGKVYQDHDFFGDLDYTYWNVGLTVGFLEKWSLDVRYWDTDGEGAAHPYFQGSGADDRVVGTIKYSF